MLHKNNWTVVNIFKEQIESKSQLYDNDGNGKDDCGKYLQRTN